MMRKDDQTLVNSITAKIVSGLKLRTYACSIGTALATIVSASLSAQAGVPAGAAISGSLGRAVISGSDHAGLAGSPSFEGVARYTTPWQIQIAGLAHYSRYPIGGTGRKLNLITFIAEPRVQLLPSTRRFIPYVGFRVGRVWETLRARGANLTNLGNSIGGSLGFEVATGEQVGLEFGASMDWMSFREFEVDGSTAWENCLENDVPAGAPMVAAIQTCVPFVNRVLAQVGVGPGGTLQSIAQPGSESTGRRLGLWIRLTLYLQPN